MTRGWEYIPCTAYKDGHSDEHIYKKGIHVAYRVKVVNTKYTCDKRKDICSAFIFELPQISASSGATI